MKIYRDIFSNARQSGKKNVADVMTQSMLSQMKPGQTFALASIHGVKYFRCFEPKKQKLKIFYESA